MFIIYDKNMNIKEFPKGVRPLDIFIGSINKQRYTDQVEGMSGIIDKGFKHLARPVEISLRMKSQDTRDYRLLRDEVFSFFSEDYFYISEQYQMGKRYKVMVVDSFIPERLNQTIATARFSLQTVDLPYAESIGTTQELENNFDYRIWTDGMGLLPDSGKYTHESTEFQIYNAGIPIHPFEQELKITIIPDEPSENLTLTNNTTGNTFQVNRSLNPQVNITLDGPAITLNGLQILRDTNKEFIELAHGWNEFEVSVSAKVSFDFRFYY